MEDYLYKRLELASEVARTAGELALSYYEQAKKGQLTITTKETQDWLSEADQAVEALIQNRFAAAFPQDGFLGEETGGTGLRPGTWVVDPIDGTSNFVRGIDLWCISIAYYCDGRTKLGLIYDPVRERMFSAGLGQGAYCNGEALRVSSQERCDRSMVILGYSLRTPAEEHLATLRFLNQARIDFRRFGSAAIGLSEVAAGRAEGYFEQNLMSWDCLAGMLLVEESGGVCTPYSDPQFVEQGGLVLASNAALRPELNGLLELG